MHQTILPLSPLLVNKQNLKYRYIFCCFLTQMSFSQGAGDRLAAALRHGATLRCCHQQKWAATRTCMPTGDARRHITMVHACARPGRLVDHRYCTLHSKCTFSRRTFCSVSPLQRVLLLSLSLLALFHTRHLLLNTVYLQFVCLFLFFSFFHFWTVCLISPPSTGCLFPIGRVGVFFVFSVKVFSPYPPPRVCLDCNGGICLSRYLCCALVLICIPSR